MSLLDRMPMLKDNIAKWLHPPARNQFQDWRWETKDVTYWRWTDNGWKYGPIPQPHLQRRSQHSKPGENVFKSRNCYGLNFGMKNVTTFGIPFLTMNLDRNNKISKETLEAPMNCFVVFVGGRFLKNVDSVVERAKEVSAEFGISKPSMYFFEGRHQDIETDLDIPMVKYFEVNKNNFHLFSWRFLFQNRSLNLM